MTNQKIFMLQQICHDASQGGCDNPEQQQKLKSVRLAIAKPELQEKGFCLVAKWRMTCVG